MGSPVNYSYDYGAKFVLQPHVVMTHFFHTDCIFLNGISAFRSFSEAEVGLALKRVIKNVYSSTKTVNIVLVRF